MTLPGRLSAWFLTSSADAFLAFSKAKPKKQGGMLQERCLERLSWSFTASSTPAERGSNFPALKGPSCHSQFPTTTFERQDRGSHLPL